MVILGPFSAGNLCKLLTSGFSCTLGGAFIESGTFFGIQLHPAKVAANNIATKCFKS